MKRIAVIEDGYARDTQVFTADPGIITEENQDWENEYRDVKNICLFVGIFDGADEEEIKKKAAETEGVHPNVISLVAGEQDDECPSAEAALFEYERLLAHTGHDIKVVTYGGGVNVTVECADCHEVLFSADNPLYKYEKQS